MKRILALTALFTLAIALPASAATPHYGTFGNLAYNDCQYETAANLVLHQDPSAKISTAEVLRAFKAHGIVGPNSTPAGLDYLENIGFAGWRATATQITGKSEIIAAANAGGVFVTLGWGHAVSIIHANPKKLDIIDDGTVPPMSWSNWHGMYAAPDTVYYALTWQKPGTEQVIFDGMSVSGGSPMMAPQVEAQGSTEPLDKYIFCDDGYAFDGWSTNPQGPVQYADGANYTFTQGATLYAIVTYTGQETCSS